MQTLKPICFWLCSLGFRVYRVCRVYRAYRVYRVYRVYRTPWPESCRGFTEDSQVSNRGPLGLGSGV